MSEKRIEDVINEVLKGEAQKNALDFAAFLNENEIIVGENLGEAAYKGEAVCYMHFDGSDQVPGPWTIWSDGSTVYEYEDVLQDEGIRETAWAHANVCGDCGAGCSPGKRKTIFGKEFDNICSATFMFTNPDAKTLECVKQLLKIRINAIQ